jgi:hypothetical protein
MRQRTGRQKVVGGGLVVVALVAALVTLTGIPGNKALQSRGLHADGVVEKVYAGKLNSELVRFAPAGGPEVVAEMSSDGSHSEGDHVQLLYDPRDPTDNVIFADEASTPQQDRITFGVITLLAAVLAGLTLTGLLHWQRRRRG